MEYATGQLLGAALDAEWLRHRIYERVDVAPAIEELRVEGVRLLAVYVAAAREPVEDIGGRLRWRTGGQCVPVDRAEWWLHRQDVTGHDPMAAITNRTIDDISPAAVEIAKRYTAVPSEGEEPVSIAPADLLIRLGVRRPDGRLTQAGVLMFCPARVRLAGGSPVVPVMNLLSGIQPAVRQRDVRVALIVWTLLHEPFVVPEHLVGVLQRPVVEVSEALETAAECRIGDQPLLVRYRDVWMLSKAALRVVDTTSERQVLRRRGVLTYRRLRQWGRRGGGWRSMTATRPVITRRFTGMSQPGALNQLARLEEDGILTRRTTMGRNAHFVSGPAMTAARPRLR